MNVKYLNPFIEAAAEVLSFEIQATVSKGNLSLQKSSLTTNDLTVLINLVGQIQGVVLYCLHLTTGLAMVSRMMDQPFEEFDNLAQSGIAELGNVISGRATVKLTEAGIHSTISTPTLILGNGVQISTLDFPRIVVPIQTDMGEMTIHLAVRESPEGQWENNYVPLIQNVVCRA